MAGAGLAELVHEASDACRQAGSPLEEFSSEANSESLDSDLSRALAEAGLTRISLGVQSLNDAELARLGRVHDRTRAIRAASAVRSAGLDLSCDLMCAIPLQTAESLGASLHGVLDAGASHVSCYPLMVEEGTPLWRACESGEEAWPEDDAEADLMLLAERVLTRAGLTRYEVASYARSGHACQHNIAYWTGRSYLGLGTSAASMLTPQEFAALAEALPLLCVPEDPAAAGSELWGSVKQVEPSGTHGASIDPAYTSGPALAMRALAAGEDRIARIRIRMTDNARSLTDAMRGNAPLHMAVEMLSKREALTEDLMLGMRMSAGVGTDLLERARTVMGASLDAVLANVETRGLATRTSEGRLAPTEQGWLLGNELYGALWDLA